MSDIYTQETTFNTSRRFILFKGEKCPKEEDSYRLEGWMYIVQGVGARFPQWMWNLSGKDIGTPCGILQLFHSLLSIQKIYLDNESIFWRSKTRFGFCKGICYPSYTLCPIILNYNIWWCICQNFETFRKYFTFHNILIDNLIEWRKKKHVICTAFKVLIVNSSGWFFLGRINIMILSKNFSCSFEVCFSVFYPSPPTSSLGRIGRQKVACKNIDRLHQLYIRLILY